MPRRARNRADDFAQTLAAIREDGRVSQDTLAVILGVSRRTLSKWECCKAFPTRAQALDVVASLTERARTDPALMARLVEVLDLGAFVSVTPLAGPRPHELTPPREASPPPPALADALRPRIDAALHAVAEDAELPAGPLRRALLAVLDAIAASGGATLSVVEARALVVRPKPTK